MSSTQTSFTGFAAATEEARELPKLNCIGSIGSVGTPKVSQQKNDDQGKPKAQYIVQPITIEPTQGGKKGFVNFLYRPEWLRPSFNPASLKAEDDGTAQFFVYKMNIAGTNSISCLAGLAGSEDNFGALAAKIQSDIEGKDDSKVPGIVQTILSEFATDVNPEVGYYSVQKKEKVFNSETGKFEKRAVAGQREIGGYFFPDEDSHRRNEADAAKQRSVMAYETN